MIELPIEMELRKLGLKEKESKVYLTNLEFGITTPKQISEILKIPRATVYEILKSLKNKGLVEEIKIKGKKKFLAKSPGELLAILRLKKREIEEKEREFIRIIGLLEAKYLKERGLRVLKGEGSFKTFLEILSFSATSNILIINQKFLPFSEIELQKIFEKIKKRLGKLKLKKFEMEVEAGLIIFDKIAIFPKGERKCFLFE